MESVSPRKTVDSWLIGENNRLYRNCKEFNCEMILVIKEPNGSIIGGILSNSLKSFPTFYGTGECQVFSFINDELKAYESSLENNYFIFSNDHGFGMGSGYLLLSFFLISLSSLSVGLIPISSSFSF